MMLYKLMLVMLVFAAANTGLNAAALYTTQLPESQKQITQAQVTDYSNSMAKVSTNPWTALELLGTSLRFIVELALSIFTLAFLFQSMGVPLWLSIVLSAPTTLVLVWGIYEIATGHVSMPQD